MADLEFFFSPVCPFCWVTSQWVRKVQRLRGLEVTWRFISLAILNEGSYEGKPDGYEDAHGRGLELLRVAAAVRADHGIEVIGDLYEAMGRAVWQAEPPDEDEFEAILQHSAEAGDIPAILREVGLPEELAEAANDGVWDAFLRAETEEALERAGGDVGTPILSFSPPDGPAFFGPVISELPDDQHSVALWEAVEQLARFPGFAELKRSLRSFPHTPVTRRLAGQQTRVS